MLEYQRLSSEDYCMDQDRHLTPLDRARPSVLRTDFPPQESAAIEAGVGRQLARVYNRCCNYFLWN